MDRTVTHQGRRPLAARLALDAPLRRCTGHTSAQSLVFQSVVTMIGRIGPTERQTDRRTNDRETGPADKESRVL